MDYIEEILGLKVTRQPWQATDLPYHLVYAYEYTDAMIGTQPCLIITPQEELSIITGLAKQLKRIQQTRNVPVVLEVQALSRQRRESLIVEKIPFIVPGKQLYLPFMGVMLQEKYDRETAVVEKLQPSAQLLLFHFIYTKTAPMYLSRLPAIFNYSAMTVSRAAAQLISTGLLDVHKEGVQKVLTSQLPAKELFEKARPFLLDPARRRFYIDKTDLPEDAFKTGESALSDRTMLGLPNVEAYGTAKTQTPASATAQLIDAEKQCQLELWRYDPAILSGGNGVDALSLALSLARINDERVEMCIDEMLEGVWANGSRI